MKPSLKGYLLIAAAASLWAVAGVLSKFLFAQRSVDPLLLSQIRMGFSTVILAGVLLIKQPRLLRVERSDLLFVTIWGIVGLTMVQFTYLYTISLTSVATAIFLQYLSPVFTALYIAIVSRTRPGALLTACLGLALTGSYLLIFGAGGRLLVTPLGLTVGLASALFMAFYTIYGSSGLNKLNPWTLLLWGQTMGTLFWLVVNLVLFAIGSPLQVAGAFSDLALWGYYLYIAVMSAIVPFGLFLSGLRYVQPTQATITGMLEPVVASGMAFFVLGEALTGVQIGGAALIVAAVCLLQVRRFNSSKKAPSAA